MEQNNQECLESSVILTGNYKQLIECAAEEMQLKFKETNEAYLKIYCDILEDTPKRPEFFFLAKSLAYLYKSNVTKGVEGKPEPRGLEIVDSDEFKEFLNNIVSEFSVAINSPRIELTDHYAIKKDIEELSFKDWSSYYMSMHRIYLGLSTRAKRIANEKHAEIVSDMRVNFYY